MTITLTTLKDVTDQEVFDQVANHLLTQNQKSIEGQACLYRGPNGLKCAAGCLISDDEYDPSFDDRGNSTWFGLVNSDKVPSFHMELITQLQRVHDGYGPQEWRSELKELAEERRLEFNYREVA